MRCSGKWQTLFQYFWQVLDRIIERSWRRFCISRITIPSSWINSVKLTAKWKQEQSELPRPAGSFLEKSRTYLDFGLLPYLIHLTLERGTTYTSEDFYTLEAEIFLGVHILRGKFIFTLFTWSRSTFEYTMQTASIAVNVIVPSIHNDIRLYFSYKKTENTRGRFSKAFRASPQLLSSFPRRYFGCIYDFRREPASRDAARASRNDVVVCHTRE